MNVVVLTTVHPRDDNRIFFKENSSIAKISGVDLTAIVADGLGDENREFYEIVDLGCSRGRTYRFFVSGFKAFSLLRRFRPDVLHIHDPELMIVGFLLSFYGVRVVFDAHENIPEDIKDKYWIPKFLRGLISSTYNLVEKLFVNRFSAVIAATSNIRMRYPAHKSVLLQNYPKLEEFSDAVFDQTAVQTNNVFTVSYVGAITVIRGIDNVVDALELLNGDAEVRFNLAGVFQQQGHLERLQSKRGWEFVDFVGKITRDEIGAFLGASQAGILTLLPANNHINSQPNKLFEYMAAGLPVIASDFPLWRELIERYDCGYLVDPESPESIAAAIRQVMDNPEEAKAKGLNGQRAIRSELNWEVESKRLVDLYQRLSSEISGNS